MIPLQTVRDVAGIVDLAVVLLVVGQVTVFMLVFVAAARALIERPPLASPALLWKRYSEIAPAVTIISPAYNESATIAESVEALLDLQYPEFEVIVVNDGSSDDTLARLIARFDLHPTARLCDQVAPHAPIRGYYTSPTAQRLLVVDKENGGGKADAVNAGINAVRTPLICITDADTLMEPDALLRAVWPFIEHPHTIAVGGTICIANGSKVRRGRVVEARLPSNFLALVQTLEYERSFMLARLGMSRLGASLIVSGAFGLFRHDAVVAVGGYSLGSIGEDLELVIKLHRYFRSAGLPYAIRFLAEPVVWTQAPESFGDLGRQRSRWQRGALETFFQHASLIFNPRYGAVGMIGFAQLILVDIVGPLIAVLGYIVVPISWAVGILSAEYFLAFVAAVFTLGILMSVLSLILEQVFVAKLGRVRDFATLALVAVVENFGYRQLCNLWRIRGWYQFLRKEQSWGSMNRQNFTQI
ncbi:MAG: glycosyltransferase [Sphingomicrobium sp.]